MVCEVNLNPKAKFAIMKKRTTLFLRLFFIAVTLSVFVGGYSQDNSKENNRKEIKGTVKDEEGNPLQGVSVLRKSNEQGTATNAKGNFTIKVNDKLKTLIFSMVGYAKQEVNIENITEVNIVMIKTNSNLDEVVVVGYGTTKRKDLTGAISNFKPKRTDAQNFNTVDGLMRGRAAGVQVQQSGGDPGGALSVKIRGTNSLRGDNEPLYVVDGIIINNVTIDNSDPFKDKSANSGQSIQNGLSGINPQDIESIEVLKDASATAIYGSRGANGVVIITTKSGKGKPVIMYSSFFEFSKASKQLKMLDATGYANFINDVEALYGRAPKFGLDTLQNVNWQRTLQQQAISQNHRLSIAGASADNKTKYYFGLGFLNNQGIIQNSFLKQGDLRFNLQQDLSNKLKLNFTLSTVYSKNSMTLSTEPLGGGQDNVITKMLVGVPILNAQPSLTDPTNPYDNPLSWLQDYDDFSIEKRLLAGLGLTYKISNTFSYKLNVATDLRDKERKRWFGKTTFQGSLANGSLGLSQFARNSYQIENLLMFNKKLNKNHHIEGTIGMSYDDQNISNSSVINENFFSSALRTEGFGYGQVIYPYKRERTNQSVLSYLGRVLYNFNDKYLLTLTGRIDGSSKFAEGSKYSFFPAASAAWRVSNENFLRNSKLIRDLKLRAGYGRTGNQAIDPYGTFARYGQIQAVNGNQIIVGAVTRNIKNDGLKWETTDQFNAGIDFGLWDNKVTGTVDVYTKRTRDLLQTFSIPASSGYDFVVKNIGEIENKGLEISLTGHIVNKKNFTLSASGNIAFNTNKILDLGLPSSNLGIYNFQYYLGQNVGNGTFFKDAANLFAVGQPIGVFYGYQTNGVYQKTDNIAGVTVAGVPVQYGDLKMVDQDGNKNIDANDKVIIGNPNPKFVFGFSLNMNYKKWSMDAFFNGVSGSQVVNGNLFRIGNLNGNTNNNVLESAYKDAWNATTGGNSPRIGYNNLNLIDRYVEDASFLRLATLVLSYTTNFSSNNVVKSMVFNVTGKNLLTITNYSGFDPEVNSFAFDKGKIGVDWGSYPNLRSISLGVNFTF